jgi:CO/xanthine dehydrogenase Mo-binding subunit
MAFSCAVAQDRGDVLTVWTHSQGVYPLRRELARLLDRSEDRLRIIHADGPGCYGHNAADDVAAFAALAATAADGRPVRLQLAIHDEFAWEPYGSAMSAELEAGYDPASGRLTAWRSRIRTDVHGVRPNGDGNRLVAAWLREDGLPRPWPGPAESGARNAEPPYDIPIVDVVAHYVRGPLRTGSLRSLGAFFNLFAVESFMDELADACHRDPLEFRLANLGDDRARTVLRAAADAAGWRPRVGPSGDGQGLAVGRYKGTKAYVAAVVDATFAEDVGRIDVHRVVMACDAGRVVNPDGLVNQLQGGALQALSRTLHEEVRLDDRGVRSHDWTDYKVLGFSEVPRIDVVLVDRPNLPPLGAGESATPPVAAALANALDDAIGIRVRDLPLTSARLEDRALALTDDEQARVRL